MSDLPLAFLIGHPVSHSLSPAIFRFLSEKCKLPISYEAKDIPPDQLEAEMRSLRDKKEFLGLNVTIPHKEKILTLIDSLSPEAKALGAVNVVKHHNGILRGWNTDVFGVMKTLKEQNLQMAGQSAMIFGAGGAARAVVFALGSMQAKNIIICNRSEARAEELIKTLSPLFPNTEFSIGSIEAAPDEDISLYVNCTPLGMTGFSTSLPLPKFARDDALAFDLVYNPEETPFLKAASKAGLKCVSGLDMLAWQAIGTWEIWFSPLDQAQEIKQILIDQLRSICDVATLSHSR